MVEEARVSLPSRSASLERAFRDATGRGRFGSACYAFEQLSSTMDPAHRLAKEGALEGACVWAERQTGGRGRAGRAWLSPTGGLYLSVILRPVRAADEVPQLALLAGLAAVHAIRDLTGLAGAIRWPNDVLIRDRKVAGILAESAVDECGRRYVIIGIGVNVSTAATDLPEEAAGLAQWIRTPPSRCALAAAWLRELEGLYARWNAEGFTAVRPELIRWCGFFGRLVRLTTGRGTVEGQVLDVDESGRLVVRLDSGLARAFDAGEVSLLRHSR